MEQYDNVTGGLCSWVAGLELRQVPPGAVDHAKAAILDTIGVAIAGLHEPATQAATRAVVESGGRPVAGQLGARLRTSAEQAAFLNGVSGHVLDYDDVNRSCYGHPSVVILPAALAVAQAEQASGGRLLEAYVAGVEAMGKLGRAAGPGHYAAGWHATSTLGCIAAALAAGRAMTLDTERLSWAVAIAVSQAAGTRRNFGTMTKAFHAGNAARCGVTAALLARQGLIGDPAALDGPEGFFELYSDEGADPALALGALGSPFELVSPGLSIKRHPCCFATHRAVDAVLDLLAEERFSLGDVERITVTMPKGAGDSLIASSPQTGLEGKFSLSCVLGTAILDGGVALSSFSDELIRRPALRALHGRVALVEDAATPRMQYPTEQGMVEVAVHLAGGRVRRRSVAHARGSPEHPLASSELLQKFVDCVVSVLDAGRAREAASAVEQLETVGDVNDLVRLVTP